MRTLYVGSTASYAGKNLVVMALGMHFAREGLNVGYMKPVGAVPWRKGDKTGDEDAAFVMDVLGLDDDPELVTPVLVTRDFTVQAFKQGHGDLLPRITSSFAKLAEGRDVMLVAGSGSFTSSGTYSGTDGPSVARALDASVLLVDRYDGEVHYDDLLVARAALGEEADRLAGVLFNDVPDSYRDELDTLIAPFLNGRGVEVLGTVPRDPLLGAIKVADLAERLSGKIVTAHAHADRVVENFLIGTMQVENFLTHFRKHKNSAVIVGGDRSDVQLVALEGSCPCLILTGNLYPNDIIMTRSEVLRTPIITVREDTYTVARKMENILSRHKLRDAIKVNHGAKLVSSAMDVRRLREKVGV